MVEAGGGFIRWFLFSSWRGNDVIWWKMNVVRRCAQAKGWNDVVLGLEVSRQEVKWVSWLFIFLQPKHWRGWLYRFGACRQERQGVKDIGKGVILMMNYRTYLVGRELSRKNCTRQCWTERKILFETWSDGERLNSTPPKQKELRWASGKVLEDIGECLWSMGCV